MKRTNENPTELEKLSAYFLKIEKLATQFGIDVDDLMNEYKNSGFVNYSDFKEELLSKASERATTFKKAKSDPPEGAKVMKK